MAQARSKCVPIDCAILSCFRNLLSQRRSETFSLEWHLSIDARESCRVVVVVVSASDTHRRYTGLTFVT